MLTAPQKGTALTRKGKTCRQMYSQHSRSHTGVDSRMLGQGERTSHRTERSSLIEGHLLETLDMSAAGGVLTVFLVG